MEFYSSSDEFPALWEELPSNNSQGMQQDFTLEERRSGYTIVGQATMSYGGPILTSDAPPMDHAGVHPLLTDHAVETAPLTGVQQSLPIQAEGYDMHQEFDAFRDFTTLLDDDVPGGQVVEGWGQNPPVSTQPIQPSSSVGNPSPGVAPARSSSNGNIVLGEYRPRGSGYRPRASASQPTNVGLGDLGTYRPRGSAYTPRVRPTPTPDIGTGRPYRPRGPRGPEPPQTPASPTSSSGASPGPKKRGRSSSSNEDSSSSPKRRRVAPASQQDATSQQATPSRSPSTVVGDEPIVAVDIPWYPVQQPAEESTPRVQSTIQESQPTDRVVCPPMEVQGTAMSALDVFVYDSLWQVLYGNGGE